MHIANFFDLQRALEAGSVPRQGTILASRDTSVGKKYALVTTTHEQKTS
jgi:hypothetical protein